MICLGSSEEWWDIDKAYISIVTPTNNKGNFNKIADFTFDKNQENPFIGRPCAYDDEMEDFIDIEGDGDKEIIVNLGLLGVSGYKYGILRVNEESNQMEFIKVNGQRGYIGNIEDYFFTMAATAMHNAHFSLEDIDNDGILEIIEEYRHRQEGDCWETEILVYRWEDSMFNYVDDLYSSSVECN